MNRFSFFLALLLPLLLGLSGLKAQEGGFNRVYHIPPQSEGFAKTVLELDSSYLVQGIADTNLFNNWGRTLMFYRLDRSGDTLETSRLVGGGVHDYWAGKREYLIKAPDSGFYMVGNFDDTSSYASALLYRISPDLDTLWTRSYGGSDTLWDKFSGIEPLADGNYLIFGQKGHPTYGHRAWFLKVDPQGNILWEKRIGANHDGRFSPKSVEQTFDGGFILGGVLSSWYPNGNDFTSGWVAKLDSSGNKEWNRVFMGDHGYSIFGIAQRNDSTFIAGGLKPKDATGGNPIKFNGLARKYDQDGTLLWEKEYPPGRPSSHYKTYGGVRYMEQGKDGGLIFAGFKKLNPVTNPDSVWGGWVFKTEADGDLLWMRSFRYHNLGEHRFWNVREVEKKRILAVGFSTHPDTTYGRRSPWVLKLDSMGCVSSGCAVSVPSHKERITSGFQVFPNPNEGRFSIRSERQKGPYKGTLRIFDQKGRTMVKRELEGSYPFEERIRLPEARTGIYFVEWRDANGRYVRKVVVK